MMRLFNVNRPPYTLKTEGGICGETPTPILQQFSTNSFYNNREAFQIKDNGVIYNEETGITPSGKKLFEEWRTILKEAGW